ncbi:MAG: hypothetical protein ACLRZ9_06020 [Eubacterium sp.]
MDELIRKSDVLKLIEDIKSDNNIPKNYGTLLDIIRQIRNISSVYDEDMVIKQLNESSFIPNNQFGFSSKKVLFLQDTINIVKRGGINETNRKRN